MKNIVEIKAKIMIKAERERTEAQTFIFAAPRPMKSYFMKNCSLGSGRGANREKKLKYKQNQL
jgi:hypothetical protein